MPSQEEFDALKGRLEELESKLAAPGAGQAQLSPEEIQAYVKVRDVIAADWGDNCGINECFRPRLCTVCSVCRVCRVCVVCINECVCGPCLNGPLSGGGLERFGGLGG